MRNSREIQESRVFMPEFGGSGATMAPPRPNPQKAPEAAPGRAKPQPPIQRVAERFPALEEEQVTLTFLAPEAKQVNVAGKFNGWSPDATPMENTGAGEWTVRLELRSGQYEYRFVVDGHWCEDPLASQRVSNSHGEFDSVLVVPLAVRTSIL